MKLKPEQRGFTLIEVVVTLAIVAILSALATSAFDIYTIRAQLSEGQILAGPVQAAISEYYDMTGSLPADETVLNMNLPVGKYGYVSSVHNGIVIVKYDKSSQTSKKVGTYSLGLEATIGPDGSIAGWKCGPYSSNNPIYFASPCHDDLDRNGFGR